MPRPSTIAPRDPDMGMTAAVARVATSAARRRRGFGESSPSDRRIAGTVNVKATKPLRNVNVDETRARPVLCDGRHVGRVDLFAVLNGVEVDVGVGRRSKLDGGQGRDPEGHHEQRVDGPLLLTPVLQDCWQRPQAPSTRASKREARSAPGGTIVALD